MRLRSGGSPPHRAQRRIAVSRGEGGRWRRRRGARRWRRWCGRRDDRGGGGIDRGGGGHERSGARRGGRRRGAGERGARAIRGTRRCEMEGGGDGGEARGGGNLHITNTGDSSYLPSISLLSLSTISTTDRKRRQRERPRLPTQKSSSRSSAFHSAASPADLLTSQPRSMRATAVSFSAFCASLAFYHDLSTRTSGLCRLDVVVER